MQKLIDLVPDVSPAQLHADIDRIACETQYKMSQLGNQLAGRVQSFTDCMLRDAMQLAGERWEIMRGSDTQQRDESHRHPFQQVKPLNSINAPPGLGDAGGRAEASIGMSRASSDTSDSTASTDGSPLAGPGSMLGYASLGDQYKVILVARYRSPVTHGSSAEEEYDYVADGSNQHLAASEFSLHRHPVPGNHKQRGFSQLMKNVQPLGVQLPSESLCTGTHEFC
jgi:hypothetical protein